MAGAGRDPRSTVGGGGEAAGSEVAADGTEVAGSGVAAEGTEMISEWTAIGATKPKTRAKAPIGATILRMSVLSVTISTFARPRLPPGA